MLSPLMAKKKKRILKTLDIPFYIPFVLATKFFSFDVLKVLCKQSQMATHLKCQACLSSISWEIGKGQEQGPWSTSQQSAAAAAAKLL